MLQEGGDRLPLGTPQFGGVLVKETYIERRGVFRLLWEAEGSAG